MFIICLWNRANKVPGNTKQSSLISFFAISSGVKDILAVVLLSNSKIQIVADVIIYAYVSNSKMSWSLQSMNGELLEQVGKNES